MSINLLAIENHMMLVHAGGITISYDQGFLYNIRYGRTEILKRIFFALRDENWETAPLLIENEKIHKYEKSFLISYTCRHEISGLLVFEWEVSILGSEDGVITFEIKGQALAGFKKNRLGLCVLHPLNDRQSVVEIIHSNESVSKTEFPEYIAAHTPFKDLKKMKWSNQENWFNLAFEGDVFETEDQRNWSDASFKTYCTPIELPFPVELSKGDKISQKLIFSPDAILFDTPVSGKDVIEVNFQNQIFNMPKIGIGASSETDLVSISDVDLLQKIAFTHYRIEIDLTSGDWREKLLIDHENAKKLGLPLQIALCFGDNFEEQLRLFQATCSQLEVSIKDLILLSKEGPVTNIRLASAIGDIHHQFPDVLIGVGTDYNFTEINRHPIQNLKADFISFPIQPQEHDNDDVTVIDNISAQGATVKSARNLYGKQMPVYISPLTMKKRFNPYATNIASRVKSAEERSDSRQKTVFCALFALGSIKNLTMAGADNLTIFQTIGSQGIVSASHQSFPIYDALVLVLGGNARHIISVTSSHPAIVDCLLFDDNRAVLWNYTNKSQTIRLAGQTEIELLPFQISSFNTSKFS